MTTFGHVSCIDKLTRKLKPGTRMPTFFPRGKSQNLSVLNGDTNRQIAAIWAYLKTATKHPLPAHCLDGLRPAPRPGDGCHEGDCKAPGMEEGDMEEGD